MQSDLEKLLQLLWKDQSDEALHYSICDHVSL